MYILTEDDYFEFKGMRKTSYYDESKNHSISFYRSEVSDYILIIGDLEKRDKVWKQMIDKTTTEGIKYVDLTNVGKKDTNRPPLESGFNPKQSIDNLKNAVRRRLNG